jgi:ACS family hexuronate transporter-like MFS transporter
MMPGLTPARRWALFTILCLAGVFNAMDRPVIAILKPDMSADFGWTDADFGWLGSITQFSAALSFLFTGWLVDRLGVRRSMIAGVSAWSFAALAHGWAIAAWHVVAARVGLGATEAVQTPLTIKTVASLFAPDKRSLALGAGTAIAGLGAIALPFVVPVLAEAIGWRGAMIFGAVGGFISLALWLLLARGIWFDDSAEDQTLDYNDNAESYGPILTERRTWAIVIAKALSDSTWWLMNFWLADFYRTVFKLTTREMAVPLAIAFAGSGLGAFFAGWLSTRLLEAGWSVNKVRKRVMLVSALVALILPFALTIKSFWLVACIMGLVMAAHQGFSLSLFSTITDVVPRAKVGRVTAFGAFAGNMAGAALVAITGLVLHAGYGYLPVFLFASLSYLIAFIWVSLLLPNISRSYAIGADVLSAYRLRRQ